MKIMLFDNLLLGAYFLSLFFVVFWLLTFFFEEESKHAGRRNKYPPVSVVIPSYNEEDNIIKTLSNLIKIRYPRDKLQIIVVDDGSKDRTAKLAKEFIISNPQYDITLIRQKNKGKGAALNSGLKICKGEFMVCLDADSYPEENALEIMTPLFTKGIAAVLPCMKVAKRKDANLLEKMQRYEYIVNMFYKELMAKLDCIRVTPGPFSAYRVSTLRSLGGFDENNLTEDLEIALRLQYNGYRIVQTLDTQVYTRVPTTLKDIYHQRNRWYKGSFLNTLKYKKMIMNKKFGDFGVMQMPVTLISGMLTVFLISTMAYYFIKPIINKLINLSLIRFDIMSLIRNFSFNFSLLDIKYPLVSIAFIMGILSIFVLSKSHTLMNEKLFKYGAVPFIFYIFVYFVILGVSWIGVFFDLIGGRKQKW